MKVIEDKTKEVKLVFLQELINYLQQRPYHEVYQLIHEIVKISNDKE